MSILSLLLLIITFPVVVLVFSYFLYRYARWAKRVAFMTQPTLDPTHVHQVKNTFKILSLNVKMIDWYTSMPTRILSRLIPHRRREKIIEFLRDSGHDVVLLQEALNVGFQNKVRESLKEVFPYSLSYRPRALFFGWINNGLMILSKYPLKDPQLLEFQKLVGADSWVPKGAILATVMAPKPFQVFNTHMQAFEGAVNDKLRVLGATQIRNFIQKCTSATMPLILGGDFNVSHRHKYFRALLRVFGVKWYKNDGDQKWSWDPQVNPLCDPSHGEECETLDWIFVRDLAKKVKHKAARILPVSVSDHFPVEREIVIE